MAHSPSTTTPTDSYDWFAAPARGLRLSVRQVPDEVSRPLPRRIPARLTIAGAQALQKAQAAADILAGWSAFATPRAARLQPPVFADSDPFWCPDFGDTVPPAGPVS